MAEHRQPRRERGAADAELPETTYALLGLLTFGDASGYDLSKLIAESIANFFFKPAKSQIYSELGRLVTLGYATKREVPQTDRPDKHVYAVTPEGRAALRAWFANTPAGADTIRSPACLRVFFGGLMDWETLIADVRAYEQAARAQLAHYRQLQSEIAGLPEFFFPSLVLRRGVAHERASIRWASEVRKELAGVLRELEARAAGSPDPAAAGGDDSAGA